MMPRNSNGTVIRHRANFHWDQPDILHTYTEPNVKSKGKGRELAAVLLTRDKTSPEELYSLGSDRSLACANDTTVHCVAT